MLRLNRLRLWNSSPQHFSRCSTLVTAAPLSNQNNNRFLRDAASKILDIYVAKNPTVGKCLNLLKQVDGGPLHYDHIAFRTFGIDGFGISSVSRFFKEAGYQQKDKLLFPSKKLKAYWFSPPFENEDFKFRDGIEGPLPRIFISELQVELMSKEAQDIIKFYTSKVPKVSNLGILSSTLDFLPWPIPSLNHFDHLLKESEYAAWTLINGYRLNHTAISVHSLKSELKNIKILNRFLQTTVGLSLNSEGGILKVSPDKGLLQSSTISDTEEFEFENGQTRKVPLSYIEFTERKILPQFINLSLNEIKEFHRRDGFEVVNAEKIFESTSM